METVRCLFVGAAYMPPAVSRGMGGNGERAGRIDAAPTTPQKNESRNGGKHTGRDESLPLHEDRVEKNRGGWWCDLP